MPVFLTFLRPGAYWVQLKAVTQFLIQPVHSYPGASWGQAAANIPVLLILKLIFAVLAALSFYIFEAAGMVTGLENRLASLTWPAWQMILVGGLVVPLIEEAAFRAHFKMGRLSLAATVAGLVYLALSAVFVGDRGLREGLYQDGAVLRYGASFAVGGLVYFLTSRGSWLAGLQSFWRQHYAKIFWFSIIAFGAAHIERYANFSWSEHGFFVPFIILPQVVAATFYTYTRMRYGFVWAVILHGLNNALPVIIFDVLITGPLDAIRL
ncbi:MAG: CPBP family intramembrane metalloprotease [Kordiimonadaceae bacterium]|nr:CPBP family intramembrane metalloprotease [Kordiimonadaceae bacterium]MBO6568498.1 CPBP family intramembrane metalloprotease [Kordiimonadaceae bacterium]MBO6963773.1 CPBP family intramembrane metalloprotease [Kordiimonadaceae bacterium]